MALIFSHAARLPMDIVYFDLETQRTANDVGGWDKKHQMGMSVGVTYSTVEGTYEIFPESRAGDLVARLRKADPDLRISNVKDRAPYRRPEDITRLIQGLRKAGLAE